ncbi:hypothetical protein PoB_004355300 [Plakobranchus ocellatus]|uniref:Uncharacterized protein n=1 Tax=Plakobranchus ocellatus TaxID=259542 RepID=A0AAV4BBX2_9GAST|nr:hypothetical protein PoB_004355300 [Plakobranchus ocellatus]
MAFNFFQSLMLQSQNTNDGGTPVDKLNNEGESDIELYQDEEEEVDWDIDSSDKIDPDQSNTNISNNDDGLGRDLGDTNLYQWTDELKPFVK